MANVGSRCRSDDPTVFLVGGERGVEIAVPELFEGGLLPCFALAVVLCQLLGAEPVGEPAERAAGADLLELAVVADEDDLRVRCMGVVEEADHRSRVDHRGFVDDQHGLLGQPADLPMGVEVDEEAGDRRRGDASRRLELRSGPRRERASDHGVPGGLPRLSCGVEAKRLARPGGGIDDVDAGAGGGDGRDEPGLFVTHRRPGRQRVRKVGFAYDAGRVVLAGHGIVHQSLLEGDELPCGVDAGLGFAGRGPVCRVRWT